MSNLISFITVKPVQWWVYPKGYQRLKQRRTPKARALQFPKCLINGNHCNPKRLGN
jgi:hypothetical protein